MFDEERIEEKEKTETLESRSKKKKEKKEKKEGNCCLEALPAVAEDDDLQKRSSSRRHLVVRSQRYLGLLM